METKHRPITAAECYELAGKSWMPAAATEALVRAARTIEALKAQPAEATEYEQTLKRIEASGVVIHRVQS